MPVAAVNTSLDSVVGISYGSDYSYVAIVKGERGDVIANDDGFRYTQSYVGFSGELQLVGAEAKAQFVRNSALAVRGFKRLLGKKFTDDAVKEFIAKNRDAKVVEKDGLPAVSFDVNGTEKVLTVVDLAALVLERMKQTGEQYLGRAVTGAVLAVPAQYTAAERQALLAAAEKAQLPILRLINEPTAAALAFGVGQSNEDAHRDRNVVVLDMGSTSTRVTVLAVRGGIYRSLGETVDNNLGGTDFDQKLFEHFAAEFKKKTKLDIAGNAKAEKKLLFASEATKYALSQSNAAPCSVESLFEGQDFTSTINRMRFDMLCSSLFRRAADLVEEALTSANVNKSDVDEVLLVGGGSKMPKIQTAVQGVFEDFPIKIRSDVQADEAVASGAATQAGLLAGNADAHLHELPEVLAGDLLSKTLGIAGHKGELVPIVRRDAHLPAKRSVIFTNSTDDQTSVRLAVYEGEKQHAVDNQHILDVALHGLPAAKAGSLEIEVTFTLDVRGHVHLSAVEKKSGKSIKIDVTSHHVSHPIDA